MKKYLSLLIFTTLVLAAGSQAQMRRYGQFRRYPYRERRRNNLPPFTPSASVSIGYGFPNLDKDQLYQFYNYAQGSVRQSGVVLSSFDYQFSPRASIGIMAAHGKVSAPYYDYNSAATAPVLNGSLENWSVLLNLVRYMPGSRVVSPYLRTAIGINFWTQNYTNANGSKSDFTTPNSLAYQASLGVKIQLEKHTKLFVEAGYGKYIVSGGLAFRL